MTGGEKNVLCVFVHVQLTCVPAVLSVVDFHGVQT